MSMNERQIVLREIIGWVDKETDRLLDAEYYDDINVVGQLEAYHAITGKCIELWDIEATKHSGTHCAPDCKQHPGLEGKSPYPDSVS